MAVVRGGRRITSRDEGLILGRYDGVVPVGQAVIELDGKRFEKAVAGFPVELIDFVQHGIGKSQALARPDAAERLCDEGHGAKYDSLPSSGDVRK